MMMKTARILILGLAAFGVLSLGSGSAKAEPKPWVFSWWGSHWDHLDFKPYPEDAKRAHNSQWNNSKWHPTHWIQQRGGDGQRLIEDWYFADIIRDQYDDDDIAILEVGPNFYHLGGQDKQRVMATIDYIYGITTQTKDGIFMVYDWHSHEPVGVFSRYGLHMQ